MVLYKHLYAGFANPSVLQKDDSVSYDAIKNDIIDYERSCDPVHLKRDREQLFLYNKAHKDKEHRDKQKNLDKEDTGDTTKAFVATEDDKSNWHKNKKRPHSDDNSLSSGGGPCVNCGNKHNGACNKDPITCNSCGGKGHLQRFCPNRQSSPKRQDINQSGKGNKEKRRLANLRRRERKEK
jgi:hypothetical protein